MRHRVPVLILVLLAAAAPARAAREWYVHYEDAQKAMNAGRWADALASLKQAIAVKPRSALQEQTYGLQFVDYVPYYQQGVCLLRMGRNPEAVEAFNAEEKQGAINGNATLQAGLVKLRGEANMKVRADAEAAENVRRTREAVEQIRRLRQEGEELYRGGKLDEALIRLAEAQKGAELLEDSSMLNQIRDRVQKVRQELNERQAQAARTERIDKALESGRKLLAENKPAEAKIKFEEVLTLDARHAGAAEGRDAAEAQILNLTTQQERAAQLAEGRALVEAGQDAQALKPLAEAAADPQNLEAIALFQSTQKRVENIRKVRTEQARLDALIKAGEALLSARKFVEAFVTFESALDLDPAHPRALERRQLAGAMTSERMSERILPNQPPDAFIDPPPAEIEVGRLALAGAAVDDRGLESVEYRVGDQVMSQQTYPPDRDGRYPRHVRLAQVFPLEPGANRISVIAVDASGKQRVVSYDVYRRLRFYETQAFLPAAIAGAVSLVGVGYGIQRARRRRAVQRRFNPYIAGAPVMAEEMFFGRQKLLSRILNVLHHNSLMITGERRIGKTTFLYHLKKALEADEGTEYRFFPVFTDLQGVTEEGFFHAVMADVIENLKLTAASLPGLRFHQRAEHYDGRDFSHDMQRVIEHLKTTTPRKVKLVLLIDEVDVLNQFSERINQRLRGIFMKTFAEHLVAIMSGVGIKRTWTSEGSPWYNFFDQIELAAFTRDEAEELIRRPVEDVFRWRPEAVEKILEASALKPYVIQKYCIHAVNRMLEQGRTTITAEDVEAVRADVNFEGREEAPPSPATRRQASA